MTLKILLRNYFNTGITDSNNSELKQQIFATNMFIFFGCIITFLMAISAVIRGDYTLAIVLLISSALFVGSHFILKSESLENKYEFAANLVTISLVILMIFLVCTGGVNNTGPLWIYLLPPVALFIGGMRKGLLNLGVFTLVISLLMFYPNEKLLIAVYSYEFKSRLMFSFLLVSSLFAFYEYSRQRSYKSVQKISDKFEQQANHDPLSGLQNKLGMLEKLHYEHERMKRNKYPMSLMMCDIDDFNKIDEKYDFETGDLIIKEIANIFSSSIRKQDTAARWGRETFLFLLPETNMKQAFLLGEKLRRKVADKEFTTPEMTISLTISVGIYQVKDDNTIEQALSFTDQNLFHAQNAGNNCCVMNIEF